MAEEHDPKMSYRGRPIADAPETPPTATTFRGRPIADPTPVDAAHATPPSADSYRGRPIATSDAPATDDGDHAPAASSYRGRPIASDGHSARGFRGAIQALGIVSSRRPNGPAQEAVQLANALGQQGVNLELLAFTSETAHHTDLPMETLSPSRGFGSKLGKRAKDAQVILTFDTGALRACAKLKRGNSALVVRNDGDHTAWVGDDRERTRTLAALRAADRVVVPWLAAGKRLVELGDVSAEQIDVIPTGVDTSAFAPANNLDRVMVRRKFGVEDQHVVLVVAELTADSRIDAAIEAVTGADDLLLVVIGDGPEREALTQKATVAPVRFVGASSEALPWYQVAEVAVVPGRSEGIPRAAIEAGLCGLPVVATDVGGARDVVVHEETGLLLARNSIGELGDAIRQAMTHRGDWGQAASARCRDLFDLTDISAAWAATLKSVF
ncbi:MAG: glycosyltransferase family 4 protein [Actinomycetota bacterium]